jgi:hypothetical protein
MFMGVIIIVIKFIKECLPIWHLAKYLGEQWLHKSSLPNSQSMSWWKGMTIEGTK